MNGVAGSLTECDLLIIGAGPVGLYAAYYAGFRGLRVALMDSLPEAGGQVSAMYPEKPIYDVAGFPAVRGRDLVGRLVEQAGRSDPVYLLGERACHLARHGDGTIEVRADSGTGVRCRAVIISGGIGTFIPRPLPAGRDWVGRGVSYFVPELAAHAGQDVIVVGGGDSACDWALSLEPIACSVTLVHRRGSFRAHERTVADLHASTVEVITGAEVSAVCGGDRVSSVEITTADGASHSRAAQAVIAALGFTANLGPIRDWGIDITDRSCIEECPVDCIYEGARKLYINPGECIDCGACEPACPVEAISQDRRVPGGQEDFVADNARFFTEPLPGRDQPLGNADGGMAGGPIGVDTDLVAAWAAA